MIPAEYFDRFDTPKYRNKNPVHRALIRRFIRALHGLFIEAGPVTSVLEVGVGEGFISGYLSEKFPNIRFTGVDVSELDLARLQDHFPAVKTRVGSAYDLSAVEGPFDLIICAEVLEHLDRPEEALSEMVNLGPKRLLLSVPHEPFFMLGNLARGKNVLAFGNDPEHIGHYGVSSFKKLLAPQLNVLELQTSYPWLLALAAPR